jgi:hypothetical protein
VFQRRCFCPEPSPSHLLKPRSVSSSFFAVPIRNANTRTAYYRAIQRFLAWVERAGYQELEDIEPITVAAYIETLQRAATPPTVKQHMAAIRRLFSWLTEKGVLAMNPAREVKTEKFSRTAGKTPAFAEGEVQKLLEAIQIFTHTGLRDRALLGTLAYSRRDGHSLHKWRGNASPSRRRQRPGRAQPRVLLRRRYLLRPGQVWVRLHPRFEARAPWWKLAGHMSAGLISLRNDHVDSGLLCANRHPDRANLMEHRDSRSVCGRYELCWITPKERQGGYPLVDANLNARLMSALLTTLPMLLSELTLD